MKCIIREWKIEDAASLAEMLNNKNILNNLRDGLPYPYTKKDAEEYITSMIEADKMKTFAFAIKLILECLKKGLYPSWDAQNKWSVALAEKLGYHFSHEYAAYEVIGY